MTDYNELVRCGECKFWSETEKGFGRCLKSGFQTPKDFLGEDGERKDHGMTDYTELVKALRSYSKESTWCASVVWEKLMLNAADAIEALKKTLEAVQKNSGINFRMWEEAQAEVERLQAQLPKRGEWVHGREIGKEWAYNHWVTYYEDWHCSNCKVVFKQEEKPKYNYCPNCGAKMEVQE